MEEMYLFLFGYTLLGGSLGTILLGRSTFLLRLFLVVFVTTVFVISRFLYNDET